jgi:glyoxylase-like metal-dependent hydrolase (beta-lactamase superfamily II)
MKLGKFEIYPLTDGFFGLDGGAMFGVVPKVIWEKHHPPDSKNRIRLALGTLLIRAHGHDILVDTGIGNKGDSKFCDNYAIDRTPSLENSLLKHGLTPRDINIVINTHLHLDHAGGDTRMDEQNRIVPNFPNAKYYIQRQEWESAVHPNERTKGSYRLEDFMVLQERGLVQFIEGDTQIVEGVRAIETPGHTGHHQSALIESEGKTALFLGDLIPTATHIPYPYIMGYDLFPLTTLKTKKKILERAYEENWLLVFQHDPKVRMGFLKEIKGRFAVEAINEGPG